MTVSRGKQFEDVIRKSFNRIQDVSVIRLPDQTMGYAGGANICDFIVYYHPYQYFIECKTVHGNTLPLTNISKNQWEGMLEQSKKCGVIAGVICWWVDKDVTKFVPITDLQSCRSTDKKSIRYDTTLGFNLVGEKKRVFFDYDMRKFFAEASRLYFISGGKL